MFFNLFVKISKLNDISPGMGGNRMGRRRIGGIPAIIGSGIAF
jgi:hypothetical protein